MEAENGASGRYTWMTALMCVCLVASNLFEIKIFNAGALTLTGGFLIFPVSYIINDCLSELYGYRKARFAILLAFASNAFVVLSAQIVKVLPPAPFWDGQDHFAYVFDVNLRIAAASMLAFLCGSLLNSAVMVKMKKLQGGRGFGWRAVLSSLAGESADSLIFFPIAFFGVPLRNLVVMMLTQIVLKTLYEIIILPVTSAFVRRAGKSNQ
ncbi:MAG: queuosine precursor transporter [Bacteroidales bacterium]|nr:queuosine precursor transporter [Candidatus Cacconaster caballi]